MDQKIRLAPVTLEMAKEALVRLARWHNKSAEEMEQIVNEISDQTIRAMNKRKRLGKRFMRSLFEKWKVSADAKRFVCTKNKAHKIEPKDIKFSSRHEGKILMVCTECNCSYKISDIFLVSAD